MVHFGDARLEREYGIFREDISQEQIDFLSEQFVFHISSWLTAARYLEKDVDKLISNFSSGMKQRLKLG